MQHEPTAAEPLRVLVYALTFADALAWTLRPREIVGFAKLAMILWLASAGFAVAFLPEDLHWAVRALAWLAIAVLWYGLYTVFVNLKARYQARRLVDGPETVALACFADRLVETRGDRIQTMPFDRIGAVGLTGRHIFVHGTTGVIIIPLAAFEDAGDMADFSGFLDKASNDAQP